MVVSEANTGAGHCGWALPSTCPVGQALRPFEDVALKKENEWATNRAQQQLLWDTLQSLKDKAAQAFLPIALGQPLEPFRETYSDGGLFGAGCNYAVGFHGIQGRQPKCEDYVLHLALGPNLFAPFNDCSRACLACVLDGHGGTGAVQYVAEQFPSYLLADLPRLRSHPAAAMRSALHRIDEELTALGHNSGTTVNAMLLIDNRVTVVNTGDCRCILYDWVEERAVQVTHDHNLLSTRERERVLGEGAEISGCGSYVVLPCPTDGAKLLGVTKALGHAGVKALQRSFTMGSLSGILETELSGEEMPSVHMHPQHSDSQPQLSQHQQLQVLQQQQPRQHLQISSPGGMSRLSSASGMASGVSGGVPTAPAVSPTSISSTGIVWRDRSSGGLTGTTAAGTATGGNVSVSGMSEDLPLLTLADAGGVNGGPGVMEAEDMCASSSALVESCQLTEQLCHQGPAPTAQLSCPSVAAAAAATAHVPTLPPRFYSVSDAAAPRQQQTISSFATPAAAALAAAVASNPQSRANSLQIPECCPVLSSATTPIAPLTGMASSGGFLLTCEPDEFEFTVEDDRHVVLLGCDGVFDHMGNSEACKTAVRHLTASNSCVDAAREVALRALRLGSLDNITALVLRFGRKPIVRRQSFSVLSLRRTSSNMSADLLASGGSASSRA